MIYSSGDGGVSGNGGRCVDSNTGHYTDGSYGRFTPLFPGKSRGIAVPVFLLIC